MLPLYSFDKEPSSTFTPLSLPSRPHLHPSLLQQLKRTPDSGLLSPRKPMNNQTASRPRRSLPSSKNDGRAQESNASSSTSRRRRTMDEMLRSHDAEQEIDGHLQDHGGEPASTHPIASGSNSDPASRLNIPPSNSTCSALPTPSSRNNNLPSPSQPNPNPRVTFSKRPRLSLDELATREMNRVSLSSPFDSRLLSSRLRVQPSKVHLPC